MRYPFTLLIFMFAAELHAQGQPSPSKDQFNLGFGVGIDYGGFGARATYLPIPRVGVFGAAGYNLNALGWNVGVQWLTPTKKNYFYFTGMYGYNAVLIVEGIINDKGTYYGLTGGVGYQLLNRNKTRHLNFELLLPLRNSNFQQDINTLRGMGAQITEPTPIAFSIGYHIRY